MCLYGNLGPRVIHSGLVKAVFKVGGGSCGSVTHISVLGLNNIMFDTQSH